MEFEKFPKIPRYHKVEMLVTEKIDGTNAQINIPEDPADPIIVGSRNRYITPGKTTDNYGFAAWVLENEAMLRRLGPGRHYGEWYGQGIGRGYGLAERRFALFNVRRYDAGLPEGVPVELVKVLYQGPLFHLNAMEDCNELAKAVLKLQCRGSVSVPGYMNPEGVVIEWPNGNAKIVFDKQCPSPEEGV